MKRFMIYLIVILAMALLASCAKKDSNPVGTDPTSTTTPKPDVVITATNTFQTAPPAGWTFVNNVRIIRNNGDGTITWKEVPSGTATVWNGDSTANKHVTILPVPVVYKGQDTRSISITPPNVEIPAVMTDTIQASFSSIVLD